ncbi:MAG: lysylphosphatidylglycerol synthase transmembrane domain-containing protein, partial [Gemmatirosa sp.]
AHGGQVDAFKAMVMGFAVSVVVPARAGELARAYALTRAVPSVPFPASLASLAVDRVFDAIVLLLLRFSALLDPVFPPGVRVAGPSVPMIARGGILAVVVLLAGLYACIAAPQLFERLLRALVRTVAARFEERAASMFRAFVDGLGALRDARRFAAVFGWTVVHWMVHALALWLGFRAVGIDAPFSAALFLQGVLAFAVALPSSPGFFGVFEWAATVGLAVYGVSHTLAVSWALGYHILSFIPITVIGALYFAQLGLRLRDVSGSGRPPGDGAPLPAGERVA